MEQAKTEKRIKNRTRMNGGDKVFLRFIFSLQIKLQKLYPKIRVKSMPEFTFFAIF